MYRFCPWFLTAGLLSLVMSGCRSATEPAPRTEVVQFRQEAATMASLALNREYDTFVRQWDTLAHAAAQAGLGLTPQDNDGRVYQSLRAVRAFIDTYQEARAKAAASRNKDFMSIANECSSDIDKCAREAQSYLAAAQAAQ